MILGKFHRDQMASWEFPQRVVIVRESRHKMTLIQEVLENFAQIVAWCCHFVGLLQNFATNDCGIR